MSEHKFTGDRSDMAHRIKRETKKPIREIEQSAQPMPETPMRPQR